MSVYKRVAPDWYAVITVAALSANMIEESMESLISCWIESQRCWLFLGSVAATELRLLSEADKPRVPYKNQCVAPAKMRYLAKIIPKKANP